MTVDQDQATSQDAPAPFDPSDSDFSDFLNFHRRFGSIQGDGWTPLQIRLVLQVNLTITALVVLFGRIIFHAPLLGLVVEGLIFELIGFVLVASYVSKIDLLRQNKTQAQYRRDRRISKRGGPWMGNDRHKDRPRTRTFELNIQSSSRRPRRRRRKEHDNE